MDFDFTAGTIREGCTRLLAAADRPLTVDAVAELVNTTTISARRHLRQLEAEGVAVRQRGGMSHDGRIPDLWRAR